MTWTLYTPFCLHRRSYSLFGEGQGEKWEEGPVREGRKGVKVPSPPSGSRRRVVETRERSTVEGTGYGPLESRSGNCVCRL